MPELQSQPLLVQEPQNSARAVHETVAALSRLIFALEVAESALPNKKN